VRRTPRHSSNRAQIEAEHERDLAIEARTQAEAERDAALSQLTAMQKAIGAMAAKEAVHVHDAIATAVPDDAARLLDAQLQSPFLPAAPSVAGKSSRRWCG
jgi:hypothetical protein